MATAPALSIEDITQVFDRTLEDEFNSFKENEFWLSASSNAPAQEAFHTSIARRRQSRDPRSLVIDASQRQAAAPTSTSPVRRTEANVIDVPGLFMRRQVENRSINTLQEWEGLVDSIEEEHFTARLKDLTQPNQPEEVAIIPISEVDPRERERIVPGALFHLFIGYTRRGGSRRRETFTYFRKHLPSTNAATSELAELLSSFDGD